MKRIKLNVQTFAAKTSCRCQRLEHIVIRDSVNLVTSGNMSAQTLSPKRSRSRGSELLLKRRVLTSRREGVLVLGISLSSVSLFSHLDTS